MTNGPTKPGGQRTISVLRDGWVQVDLPEVPWLVQVRVANPRRPEVVGLRLEARDDALLADVVVTSERLRSLPLRQIRKAAFATAQNESLEALQAIGKVERAGRQPWPDEHFAQVAKLYRRAVAAGQAPLNEIAKHWNVSRPMAAKYVRRARELELLGYPERPGVAGADRPTSPIGGGAAPTPPTRRSRTMHKRKAD